ncbi:hypothetical protein VRU48_08075 [Pedobacter sp. KR3-3]|uniref:DUF4294 domain-containing protein n=1 Tax=Pedobacter albus TaxID=3113905 RepID=A0ABU7I6H2_9SPHI|nr:hypothetical protein [Pedobacter sp. KR3-3]MEE1945060.1 hypothetical protein [Pedobacter sp. KR3-3]
MKLCLCLLLTFVLCSHPNLFYEKLLNDFDRNSWFVCINASFGTEKRQIIIENDDLFYLVNEKNKINKTKYYELIKGRLLKNETISLPKINLEKLNILEMQKADKIEKDAKKGLEAFLKIYFTNRMLKKEFIDYQNAIIYQLFKWKVLTKIDDVSGFLIFYR